jgi:hypothetical protein
MIPDTKKPASARKKHMHESLYKPPVARVADIDPNDNRGSRTTRRMVQLGWVATLVWSYLTFGLAYAAARGVPTSFGPGIHLTLALLYLGLAWGIARGSRACALSTIMVFAVVKYQQVHNFGLSAIAAVALVVFAACLASGLVGTVLLHRRRQVRG